MKLFPNFRRRDDSEEPRIEPPMTDALLSALINGETITREKALTLPAVSGAVDLISNCVACMPVKLYKVKNGSVEEVKDDPRTALLNGDTGDTLDGYQMKKAMVEDYLLGKGGYAYIARRRNDVTGLYYVQDSYITIMKNFKPIYKDYKIEVDGESYEPISSSSSSGTPRTEQAEPVLLRKYRKHLRQHIRHCSISYHWSRAEAIRRDS